MYPFCMKDVETLTAETEMMAIDLEKFEKLTAPIEQVKPEPIVQTKIIYKTLPVKTAVEQVLSIDDTPHLRAQKIQAMADAANAHAKLFDLGVYNNEFLLTNDPSNLRATEKAIKQIKRDQVMKKKSNRFLVGFAKTLIIAGATICGCVLFYYYVLV